MDYTDKIILLKSRIASKVTPDDELIKQLDIGLGIIKNTDSDTALTEQDKEFLESVIQKTEKIVGRGPIELLNDIVTVGQVPRDLYDETLPGGIVFDRVSQVPAFQVRGKRYLSDGKKISSSPPLFFLRGMQVVRLNQFKYHVAMEDWCGYPKCSHDNEWLILNYMVSHLFFAVRYFPLTEPSPCFRFLDRRVCKSWHSIQPPLKSWKLFVPLLQAVKAIWKLIDNLGLVFCSSSGQQTIASAIIDLNSSHTSPKVVGRSKWLLDKSQH